MKKILLLILFGMFGYANAQQTIPSIWAFNISNIQGSYYRAILEEANKSQNKFMFVPDHKPGAGGNIGAAYVLNQDRISLLGTAAAYFVRPTLYTSSTNYKFEDFVPVHVMALSPAALVTKDQDLVTILRKPRITIGTAGTGSLTHLMALKFAEYFTDKEITIISYKSSTEALLDVLGGHVDLTFEFLGDAEAKNAKVLGVTGTNKIKNYPLLKDIGYPNQANLVGVYLILVKKNVPESTIVEFRNIFEQAEKNNRVQELYRSDYSSKPLNLRTSDDYQRWYQQTIQYYKSITYGQKID